MHLGFAGAGSRLTGAMADYVSGATGLRFCMRVGDCGLAEVRDSLRAVQDDVVLTVRAPTKKHCSDNRLRADGDSGSLDPAGDAE